MSEVKAAVTIRRAQREELLEINKIYLERVKFQASSAIDKILVAEVQDGGETVCVGLGRLVPLPSVITKSHLAYELGGIWTDEKYRRYGIARSVVRSLLDIVRAELGVTTDDPKATVYCLPFTHLLPFYCSFGFKEIRPPKASCESKKESQNAVPCQNAAKAASCAAGVSVFPCVPSSGVDVPLEIQKKWGHCSSNYESGMCSMLLMELRT